MFNKERQGEKDNSRRPLWFSGCLKGLKSPGQVAKS
jgi:hypothetical protein